MSKYRKFIESSVLDALVMFSKLHGKPYSTEVLTEGLPASEKEAYPKLFAVKDKNAKSMFSRAAQRAGFKTRIIKIGLDEISELVNYDYCCENFKSIFEENEIKECCLICSNYNVYT